MRRIATLATIAMTTTALAACASSDGNVGAHGEAVRIVASTPTLQATGETRTSIDVEVCAGATGAPAGFTIQWIPASDLAAVDGHWPDASDGGSGTCDASYSGNAMDSRFDLAPYACTTVAVGEVLNEPGFSTRCGALTCGTSYAFRIFAHANSDLSRSAFSADYYASTEACVAAGCTLTQGYWKNHADKPGWPVTALALGSVTYDESQLLVVFGTSASGNGLVSLAHQLAAAKLNLASGADGSSIASTITAADALIGGLVVPSVGSGYLAPSTTSGLTTTLTSFNEGLTGPGHCGEAASVTILPKLPSNMQ